MAEHITALASGAAAAGASAAMSGLPPGEVIVWALLGGLFAVYVKRQAELQLTRSWIVSSVLQMLVSAAVGVAGSAVLQAVAPAYSWTAPLASAPQWAIAFGIAAGAFRLGPPLLEALMRRLGVNTTTGGGNAQ